MTNEPSHSDISASPATITCSSDHVSPDAEHPADEATQRIAQHWSESTGQRNVLAINEANDGRWVEHWTPEVSTTFAVQVPDHVVAIDCDYAPRSPESLFLGDLVDRLREADVPFVLCNSGGAGRQHLFVVTDGERSAKRLGSRASAAGLDVRRMIRLPGSPHRSGNGRSIVTEIGTAPRGSASPWAQAADVLCTPGASRTASDRLERLLLPPIPAHVHVALSHGHERAGFPSASEARAAVAVAVVRARLPFAYLVKLLTSPKNELSKSMLRRSSHKWRSQELRRLWQFANGKVGAREKEARRLVPGWLADVDASGFSGRNGLMTVAVAEHLARLAALRLSPMVAESVGGVAAGTNSSKRTARRALNALVSAGLLERAVTPTAVRATVWRLRRTYRSSGTRSWVALGTLGDLGDDLVLVAGRSVIRVVRAVLDGAETAHDVAEHVGCTPSAARSAIYRARRHGLLQPRQLKAAPQILEVCARLAYPVRGRRQSKYVRLDVERALRQGQRRSETEATVSRPMNMSLTPGKAVARKTLAAERQHNTTTHDGETR